MRLTGLLAVFLIPFQSIAGVDSQLSDCAIIFDKAQRLACYDELAASVSSQIKTFSTNSVSMPEATGSRIEQSFGKVPKRPAGEVNKLYFEVASISKDPYGALKLTFTNGQIWKQTEVRRFKVVKGDKVFIERGALGSFLLGMDNQNTNTRVKRIN